jgi:hypothetical protein
MIRSSKVLNAARGKPCTARFPGICNGDPATVVSCHLNGAAFGKGMGQKAHDILTFRGCFACHAYYDTGHGTNPLMSDAELNWHLLRALSETIVGLVTEGVVIVPLDASKLSSERPVKPRKPKDQRPKIQSRNEWATGRKIPNPPSHQEE